jgi:hypothetical protein
MTIKAEIAKIPICDSPDGSELREYFYLAALGVSSVSSKSDIRSREE